MLIGKNKVQWEKIANRNTEKIVVYPKEKVTRSLNLM